MPVDIMLRIRRGLLGDLGRRPEACEVKTGEHGVGDASHSGPITLGEEEYVLRPQAFVQLSSKVEVQDSPNNL